MVIVVAVNVAVVDGAIIRSAVAAVVADFAARLPRKKRAPLDQLFHQMDAKFHSPLIIIISFSFFFFFYYHYYSQFCCCSLPLLCQFFISVLLLLLLLVFLLG